MPVSRSDSLDFRSPVPLGESPIRLGSSPPPKTKIDRSPWQQRREADGRERELNRPPKENPIATKAQSKRPAADKTRINDQIRVPEVRVVDQEGKMLGVLKTAEALQLAVEAELDLVEVSSDSTPPVCRIMDYGKALYERRKKRAGGTSHRTMLKQIRLRAKTEQHDIDFKIQQARSFLQRKHKVKINVLFRGRENAHHDRGREMLDAFIEELKDVGTAEAPPRMESKRSISVLLGPRSTG